VRPDVLVISASIDGAYPSVNSLGKDGRRYGRKTDEYKALFAAVKDAASAEMFRTGWVTTSDECEVTVTRYVRDRRRRDAGNMSKVELDALSRACVWEDDSQATRVVLEIMHDPKGEDRVVIVVRRWRATHFATSNDVGKREVAADGIRRKQGRSLPCSATSAARSQSEQAVSSACALLNGHPISQSEAMKLVRGLK
jgi:Holliday junction resolvase RusA-like endonuclease